MQKQVKLTVAANSTDEVVELGFVPDRIVAVNRTTLYKVEWNKNLEADTFYETTNTGTTTLEAADLVDVIDGSDKTNNITSSFGFIFKTRANVQDTLGEILDIVAFRDDL